MLYSEVVDLTSNDDILETSRDGAVSVLVKHGLVTSVQPQDTSLVTDHDLGRLLRVVPVAGLQLVAADAELAARADGDNVALVVHDLGVGVGHQGADGGQALVDAVVGEGVEAGGGRLGEAVAAGELGHAKALDHELHQVPGHGRAGDDAGPEPVAVEVWRQGQVEQRVEHGRDAVARRALLVRDGAQHGRRVKDLLREDDLGAVRDDGHKTEHEAKAVEQRRGAAENVIGGQAHSVANEARVVDNVVVRQHGRLR